MHDYYAHDSNEHYLQGNRGKRFILGVWCSSDMKPSLQVRKVVAKVMQTLGIMKRSFKFLSRD